MSDDTPDYSDEPVPELSNEAVRRISALATRHASLQIEIMDLEKKLKEKKDELEYYSTKVIPEAMLAMGVPAIRTMSGVQVEVVDQVVASWPQDEAKRAVAMDYLRRTGNDGILKREFRIRYGRDATQWADQFASMLRDAAVDAHAEVSHDLTIHHSTLVKFIKDETTEGRPIPTEAFGGFVRKIAVVKIGKKR